MRTTEPPRPVEMLLVTLRRIAKPRSVVSTPSYSQSQQLDHQAPKNEVVAWPRSHCPRTTWIDCSPTTPALKPVHTRRPSRTSPTPTKASRSRTSLNLLHRAADQAQVSFTPAALLKQTKAIRAGHVRLAPGSPRPTKNTVRAPCPWPHQGHVTMLRPRQKAIAGQRARHTGSVQARPGMSRCLPDPAQCSVSEGAHPDALRTSPGWAATPEARPDRRLLKHPFQ